LFVSTLANCMIVAISSFISFQIPPLTTQLTSSCAEQRGSWCLPDYIPLLTSPHYFYPCPPPPYFHTMQQTIHCKLAIFTFTWHCHYHHTLKANFSFIFIVQCVRSAHGGNRTKYLLDLYRSPDSNPFNQTSRDEGCKWDSLKTIFVSLPTTVNKYSNWCNTEYVFIYVWFCCHWFSRELFILHILYTNFCTIYQWSNYSNISHTGIIMSPYLSFVSSIL